MISLQRLRAIAWKEATQLRRDRLTFGMVIGIPLIQMILFGYAINFDVRGLDAVVVDEARTAASRDYVAALAATQVLETPRPVASAADADAALRAGHAKVAVFIPADFDRRMLDRTRPAAQIVVDGSEPSIQNIVTALAQLPLGSRHGETIHRPLPVEIRTYYNPERRTAVQIVPALIGVILSVTMVIFTAGAIVRERERGNLELLIATPVGRAELLVGKFMPYVAIGLLQTTIVLLVGHWLFRVPIVGSVAQLYVAALLFVAAALSLGLLLSTFAQTQFQAFQLAFLTMMPSILMSGFMFPFDGMPWLARAIAELIPLTHFNVLVRGIILRGAELGEMLPQVAKLVVFTLAMFSAAMLRFRKRLD
jgi:ABC-2 type transport system permease protein